MTVAGRTIPVMGDGCFRAAQPVVRLARALIPADCHRTRLAPRAGRHLPARVLCEGIGVLEQPGRGGRHRAHLTRAEEEALLAGFCFAVGQGGVVEAGPLRVAYEKQVEHPVAKSTLYRLLARHGWRKLVPRPYHPEASAKTQKAFKKSSGAW